jgi:hypothetical protein
MLRYYIIREENDRIIAIHKVRDSAQVSFVDLCAREAFRGDELRLVVIDVDDRGIVKSETLALVYMRGESMVMGIC